MVYPSTQTMYSRVECCRFLEENPLNLRICVEGENVPVPQRTVVGVQLLFLLCIFAIKVLECLSLKRMTFHSILITSS